MVEASATAGQARGPIAEIAHRMWAWMLLRGLLAVALGVLAVMWPASTVFAFTLLFAAFAFADGMVSLFVGIQSGVSGGRWGAMVFRGILGILVGVLFVAMPEIATGAYALLTVALLAAWSIIAGAFEITAGIRLRKMIEGEWLLILSGIVSLALGAAIFLLILPDQGATLLSAAWLIAIYAFAAGVLLLVHALRLKSLAR